MPADSPSTYTLRHIATLIAILVGIFVPFDGWSDDAFDPAEVAPETRHRIEPTIVRAWRIGLPRSDVSSAVEVLSAAEIVVRRPRTLADVLDGLGGLRIQRYGGFGALSSLALNGTPASHVVVIADGVRLNSPQLGDADLSLWSGDVYHAEIARGGHSALYGADAMSGIVLLRSAPPSPTARVSVSSHLGSFGYRGADVTLEAPIHGQAVRAQFRRAVSDNNYTYEWFGDGRRRWNADVASTHAMIRAELPIPIGDWTVRLTQARQVEGVPGPETGAVPDDTTPRARQTDTDTIAAVSGNLTGPEGNLQTTLSLRHTDQHYVNPAIRVDSRHRNNVLNLDAQVTRVVGGARLIAGGSAASASIRSTNTANKTRTNAGAFVMVARPIALPNGAPIDELRIDVTARIDGYSDFGDAFSPRGGLVARRGRLRLFGNVARSFRAPTFNALYWRPGGNPGLRPETGVSGTLGVEWRGRFLDAELTHERAKYRDQIRWQPNAAGQWSASNVDQSSLAAWLGRAKVRFGSHWMTLRASHSELSQRRGQPAGIGRQAPFVPQTLATAELALVWPRFSWFLRQRWVGRVFTRADNRDWLPRYSVADVHARAVVELAGVLYVLGISVENLTNRSYVVMPQFPMPGRSVRISVDIEL